MPPRPYQEALVYGTTPALWRSGARSVLWCAPVGSGKTLMAQMLVARVLERGHGAVYYIGHTEELLTQPGDRWSAMGWDLGYVKAGLPADALAQVQVCGVQTAAKRLLRPVPRPDGSPHARVFVLVDEAHRLKAAQYMSVRSALLSLYEHVYFVLMTGTPYRRDGRTLSDVADVLVEATTPREMVAAGWMCEEEVYSYPVAGEDATPEEVARAVQRLSGDVVETWRRCSGGAPTVARCAGRAHARHMAERFAQCVIDGAHVRTAYIGGDTPEIERKWLLARLAVGGVLSSHPLALDVLCTGGTLVEEGFDSAESYRHALSNREMWVSGPLGDGTATLSPPTYVPLGCLSDCAPTTSRGASVQRRGRVTRPFTADDAAEWDRRGLPARVKPAAVVLDHAGNLLRHGFLLDHEGFVLAPDRPGAPALASSAYPSFRPPATATCPACLAVARLPAEACAHCGGPLREVRLPEERADVELVRRVPGAARPLPSDAERDDYLRRCYGRQRAQDQRREAEGRPALAPGWAAVQYKIKYGEFPDWARAAAVAREFGMRPPQRRG